MEKYSGIKVEHERCAWIVVAEGLTAIGICLMSGNVARRNEIAEQTAGLWIGWEHMPQERNTPGLMYGRPDEDCIPGYRHEFCALDARHGARRANRYRA
jgi:hypothetical protein